MSLVKSFNILSFSSSSINGTNNINLWRTTIMNNLMLKLASLQLTTSAIIHDSVSKWNWLWWLLLFLSFYFHCHLDGHKYPVMCIFSGSWFCWWGDRNSRDNLSGSSQCTRIERKYNIGIKMKDPVPITWVSNPDFTNGQFFVCLFKSWTNYLTSVCLRCL